MSLRPSVYVRNTETGACFQDYLSILQRQTITAVLKLVYMSEQPKDNTLRSDVPAEEIASAYPKVLPMGTSLHFENADGFGEWQLIISSDAEKTLRKTRKKEPTTFAIIFKKLQYVYQSILCGYNLILTPGSFRMATSRLTTRSPLSTIHRLYLSTRRK